ncbi:MAG: hypothetical protein NC112_07630 [Oxalobacter formigenes]|nr:hypothetical protein [Oxalobacter formigenes]MCM1281700.1 hypothetical protein [Alistipes senegalensis]MCM1512959.1 hypothetical protein [Oxalobacter formigenes]
MKEYKKLIITAIATVGGLLVVVFVLFLIKLFVDKNEDLRERKIKQYSNCVMTLYKSTGENNLNININKKCSELVGINE